MAKESFSSMPDYFQSGPVVEEGNLGWFNIKIDSLLEGYEAKGSSDDGRIQLDGDNYDHRTIDQLRVYYKIIDEKTTASRDIDFTAPAATLSTTSFKKENIVVIDPSNGYARLYIPTLQDETYEENETVTIQLIPDDITIERSCTNCHLVVDIWKYLPDDIRGLKINRSPAIELAQSSKSKVDNFSEIASQIISTLQSIRNEEDIQNDEPINLEWSGFITAPKSGQYSLEIPKGYEYMNQINIDFNVVVDCTKYTKWDAEDLKLGLNEQMPFIYKSTILPDEIRALSSQDFQQLKSYIQSASVTWKRPNKTNFSKINEKLITTRKYHGRDIIGSYENGDLANAEQYVYEQGEINYNSKKAFEIVIEPKRKFQFYSVSSKNNKPTEATIQIRDNENFLPDIVITPRGITSPRDILAKLDGDQHYAELDLHLTSKPTSDVNISLADHYTYQVLNPETKSFENLAGHSVVIRPDQWKDAITLRVDTPSDIDKVKVQALSTSSDDFYNNLTTKAKILSHEFFNRPIPDGSVPIITLYEDGNDRYVDSRPTVSVDITNLGEEADADSLIKVTADEKVEKDLLVDVKFVEKDDRGRKQQEVVQVLIPEGESEGSFSVDDKDNNRDDDKIIRAKIIKSNQYKIDQKSHKQISVDSEHAKVNINSLVDVSDAIMLEDLQLLKSNNGKEIFLAKTHLYGASSLDKIVLPEGVSLVFDDQYGNSYEFVNQYKTPVEYIDFNDIEDDGKTAEGDKESSELACKDTDEDGDDESGVTDDEIKDAASGDDESGVTDDEIKDAATGDDELGVTDDEIKDSVTDDDELGANDGDDEGRSDQRPECEASEEPVEAETYSHLRLQLKKGQDITPLLSALNDGYTSLAPIKLESRSQGNDYDSSVNFVHTEDSKKAEEFLFLSLNSKPRKPVTLSLQAVYQDALGEIKIDTNSSDYTEGNLHYFKFDSNNWNEQRRIKVKSDVKMHKNHNSDVIDLPLTIDSLDPKYQSLDSNITVARNLSHVTTDLSEWEEKEGWPRITIDRRGDPVITEGETIQTFEIKRQGRNPGHTNQLVQKVLNVKFDITPIGETSELEDINEPYLITDIQGLNNSINGLKGNVQGGGRGILRFNKNDSRIKADDQPLSVRQSGILNISEAGMYDFSLLAHYGGKVSLKIDGDKVIKPNKQPDTFNHESLPVQLSDGDHHIEINYDIQSLDGLPNSSEVAILKWRKSSSTEFQNLPLRNLYPFEDASSTVSMPVGVEESVFQIRIRNDNIDMGDRKYQISIESDSDDGCNIASDAIGELCDNNNPNGKSTTNYRFDDYNVKLLFSNVKLVEKVDDDDISPSMHQFTTNLIWQLPESYKLYKKNDIPIIIPANTEIFFDGFLEDEEYSGYSITIPEEIHLNKTNGRQHILRDLTVFTSYNLFKKLRSDDWIKNTTRRQQVRLLTSTYEYESPYQFDVVDTDRAGINFKVDNTKITDNEILALQEANDGNDSNRKIISVALNSRPTATVTVALEINNQNRAMLVPDISKLDQQQTRIELTFTEDNWKTPQNFAAIALDNDSVDYLDEDKGVNIFARSISDDPMYHDIDFIGDINGPEKAVKKHAKQLQAISEDPDLINTIDDFDDIDEIEKYLETIEYNVPSPAPLTLKINDNDEANIIALTQSNTIINEAEDGVVDIRLSAKPDHDVELLLTPPVRHDLAFSPISLDNIADDKYTGQFEVTYLVGDGITKKNFPRILKNSQLEFYNEFGDVARFMVDKNFNVKPSDQLENGNYEVNIDLELMGKNSDIDLQSQDDLGDLFASHSTEPEFRFANQILPSPITLNFTPLDWNISQKIHIEALSDSDVENISRQPIRISSSSQDPHFDKTIDQSLMVEVVDDDIPTASLVLVSDGTEHAEPARFRVQLSSAAPSDPASKGITVDYRVQLKEIDDRIQYGKKGGHAKKHGEIGNALLHSYLLQHPNSGRQQVHIAPGKSYSEEFVIPIDDFVADKIDKKFNVELLNSNHKSNKQLYKVDQQNKKATIDIENNDRAGLLLIYPGDAIRVSEDDNGAAVLVALTSQPTESVTVNYEEIIDPGITPRQLNRSASVSFDSDDWFIPKPLAVTAIKDNVIEDRIRGTHELVQYENITDPDNPSIIIDTIPSRKIRVFNGKSETIEKLLVDESQLENTGYHPATIKFNVDSCDDDYSSIKVNQVEKIEVIDAELPEESVDSLVQSFDSLQDSMSDLPNPLSDGFDDDETSEQFEFAGNLQENLGELPYRTPAAVNDKVQEVYYADSSNQINSVSRSSWKSKNKNSIPPKYSKQDKPPTPLADIEAQYDLESGSLIVNNITNNKKDATKYNLDLTKLTIFVEGAPSDSYVLTTTVKPILVANGDTTRFKATLGAADRLSVEELVTKAADADKNLKITIDNSNSSDQVCGYPVARVGSDCSADADKVKSISDDIVSRNNGNLKINKPPVNENEFVNTFSISTGIKCEDDGPTFNTVFKWGGKQFFWGEDFDVQLNRQKGRDKGGFYLESDFGLKGYFTTEAKFDLNFPLRQQRSSSRLQRATQNYGRLPFKSVQSSNEPLYLLPGVLSQVSNMVQSRLENAYLNTNNTGLKIGVSLEPEGGFMAKLGYMNVDIRNEPHGAISTGANLGMSATISPSEKGTTRRKISELKPNFLKTLDAAPYFGGAFSFKAKLGGRIPQENVNNLEEFPTYIPSFHFGLAHEFPENQWIKDKFKSLVNSVRSRVSLPFGPRATTEPTPTESPTPEPTLAPIDEVPCETENCWEDQTPTPTPAPTPAPTPKPTLAPIEEVPCETEGCFDDQNPTPTPAPTESPQPTPAPNPELTNNQRLRGFWSCMENTGHNKTICGPNADGWTGQRGVSQPTPTPTTEPTPAPTPAPTPKPTLAPIDEVPCETEGCFEDQNPTPPENPTLDPIEEDDCETETCWDDQNPTPPENPTLDPIEEDDCETETCWDDQNPTPTPAPTPTPEPSIAFCPVKSPGSVTPKPSPDDGTELTDEDLETDDKNPFILFDVQVDLGDAVSDTLGVAAVEIDKGLDPVRQPFDVLFGDIAFFKTFDASMQSFLDVDGDSKVTINDIIMKVARIAAATKHPKAKAFCYFTQAITTMARYFNDFREFSIEAADIKRQIENLKKVDSLYNIDFIIKSDFNNLRSVSSLIEQDKNVPIQLALTFDEKHFTHQQSKARINSNQPNNWIPVIPKNTTARMDIFTRDFLSKQFPLYDFSSQIKSYKNSSTPLRAANLPTMEGSYNIKEADVRNDIGFFSLANHLEAELGRNYDNNFATFMNTVQSNAKTDLLLRDDTSILSNQSMLDIYKNALGENRVKELFGINSSRGVSLQGYILNDLVTQYYSLGSWSQSSEYSQFKDSNNQSFVNPQSLENDTVSRIKKRLGVISKLANKYIERLDDGFDESSSFSSMRVDGYVRPRTTVKIMDEYKIKSWRGRSNSLNGPNTASQTAWSSSPQQKSNRNRNAAKTMGFKNLCDNTQLNKDLQDVNFSVDPEKIAEFASNDPTWFVEEDSKARAKNPHPYNQQLSASQFDLDAAKLRPSMRNRNISNSIATPQNQAGILSILNKANRNGFYFPLIQEPQAFVELLMGNPGTDLLTYTLPNIGQTARLDTRTLLWTKPPIFKTLSGEFGVNSRLGFGYDTNGYMNWSANGSKPSEMYKLMDGFYMSDRWSYQDGAGRWLANPYGKDLPEFSIDASIMAGLEANLGVIRGKIEGGVTGTIGVDFIDNGELTGESDGKLRSYEMVEIFDNDPAKMFALQGGLYAALNAVVQVGFDVGFFSYWHDIWTQELVKIAIFEFSSVNRRASGATANDPMSDATIFFDGNLDAKPGLSEPTTHSSPSSTYMFSIENDIFDKNDNNKIDFSEGRLIAYGGKDFKTHIHQKVPFVASFGENINPITTLIRLAAESGFNAKKATSDVLNLFDLEDQSYQHTDPVQYLTPLNASSPNHTNNKAKEYIAHIKIHFLYDSLSGLIHKLLPDRYSDNLPGQIKILTDISNHVLSSIGEHHSTNEILLSAYNDNIFEVEGGQANKLYDKASKIINDQASDLFDGLDQILLNLEKDKINPSQFLQRTRLLKSSTFMHVRGLLKEFHKLDYASGQSNELFHSRLSKFIDNHINGSFIDRSDHRTNLSRAQNGSSVSGGKTRDVIIGSDNDDILNGKYNNDNLTGGAGADTFFMSKGIDKILDYNFADGDKIVVDDLKTIEIRCKDGKLLISDDNNKLVVLNFGCSDAIDENITIIDHDVLLSSSD